VQHIERTRGAIVQDMMDFRPGDHGIVPAHLESKSISGWVFLGLALVLVAGGAWIYHFRPQWVARVYDLADTSRTDVSTHGEADTQFSALYRKYGMTALGRGVAQDYKASSLLANLQKEPCDKQSIFQATVALENMRAIRGAAEMLKGFADVCPDSSGELYHASELYYLLGDYDTAVKLSSDVINQQPDVQNPYFTRAKSEQGLKRYAAAVEDYATLIRLLPDTKSIVSEVFTRMSDSYEKLDRPCEAIVPLQTYIALDSETRSTPSLLKRIAMLAAKGNCAQVYAKGVARVPRRSNGIAITRVEINGIEGKFIVDTGASFVTLSRPFAARAKPRMLTTDSVEMQTANGATSATLASLDSVKLAGLSASAVPAIVASKSLGEDVDGLLGMSFLSRFTVVIEDREIQLKAKTLGE
jgi:clan AA aspartic protease (TIGR02281 family)